jgi:hypothetical protein
MPLVEVPPWSAVAEANVTKTRINVNIYAFCRFRVGFAESVSTEIHHIMSEHTYGALAVM